MRAVGALTLATVSCLATPVAAQSYVGTWASTPAQCRVGQDQQQAPLVLKRDGYNQHEAHCNFSSVQQRGAGVWRVRARCSVEGDQQRHDFTLTVKGNRLTLREAHGERVLQRCVPAGRT